MIVLSATSSGVCLISSASIVGIPSASFTLTFSLTPRIIKKITKYNKKKKVKAL